MLPVFLVLTGMSLPVYYKDSYYAELAPMAENLRTARGKRVVILDSSNVAFGVNSALLEELLSRKGLTTGRGASQLPAGGRPAALLGLLLAPE